jgi:hypothetical protein
MGKAAAPKVCECYGPKQQNAPSSPATPVARERNPTPPPSPSRRLFELSIPRV